MTAALQRRLALGAVLAGLVLFLGANLHLAWVATRSEPACAAAEGLAGSLRAPAQAGC